MALRLRGPHQLSTTSSTASGLSAATALICTAHHLTPAMVRTQPACVHTVSRQISSAAGPTATSSRSTGPSHSGLLLWRSAASQGSSPAGSLLWGHNPIPAEGRREKRSGRSSSPSLVPTWWTEPWICSLSWWIRRCWLLRSSCCRVRTGRWDEIKV